MKKIISNYILLLSFYVLIKISKNRNIEFVIQMTFSYLKVIICNTFDCNAHVCINKMLTYYY